METASQNMSMITQETVDRIIAQYELNKPVSFTQIINLLASPIAQEIGQANSDLASQNYLPLLHHTRK